ncbi:DNA adenine methylase [Alteromonadaceae bacterium M269]|nr:DNA adenine methylase [Alteromonadaceae bacterium M269]
MPQTPSPLRYPGGKTAIWPLISKIISDNELTRGHYCEPYAGGCGLALTLLMNGFVHDLHLNDLDRSIFCFWDAILNNTDDFVEKVLNTEVTIEEWHRQRAVQENKDTADDFELAYSSFFLNRCNRSGVILKAGVIGGLSQNGNYKLDCRFNKAGLIERIRRIEKYKHRIHIYNDDAVDFINNTNQFLPDNAVYCVDPPYFVKGSTLYTNFYKPEDHQHIANTLNNLNRSWILTYDNSPAIQSLYNHRRQHRFNLNYSAAHKRIGTELLIVSDDIVLSDELNIMPAA